MIIPKCTHFFNATYPVLEDHEEEIWYNHFQLPLKCNQLGLLIFDDDFDVQYNSIKGDYSVKTGTSKRSLGTRQKLVWECYYGIACVGSMVMFKDANPFNLTQENLWRVESGSTFKRYNAIKNEFTQKTFEYLSEKAKKYEERGVDIKDYIEILALPLWLEKICKRQLRGLAKPEKRTYTKDPMDQLEKYRKIKLMQEAGLGRKKIAEILDCSEHSVTYYVQKFANHLDI